MVVVATSSSWCSSRVRSAITRSGPALEESHRDRLEARRPGPFFGILAPARRASLNPIATACRRLRTGAPDGDRSCPRLYSPMTAIIFRCTIRRVVVPLLCVIRAPSSCENFSCETSLGVCPRAPVDRQRDGDQLLNSRMKKVLRGCPLGSGSRVSDSSRRQPACQRRDRTNWQGFWLFPAGLGVIDVSHAHPPFLGGDVIRSEPCKAYRPESHS